MQLQFPNPITGKHVAIYLTGFFLVIAGANTAYIWLALTTFNGVETENAYEKGLRYNDTLALAKVQNARTWTPLIEVSANSSQAISFRISVNNSEAAGLEAQVKLIRPTMRGYDVSANLTRVDRQTFFSDIPVPLSGNWDFDLELRDEATVIYKRTGRVLVP